MLHFDDDNDDDDDDEDDDDGAHKIECALQGQYTHERLGLPPGSSVLGFPCYRCFVLLGVPFGSSRGDQLELGLSAAHRCERNLVEARLAFNLHV